MRAVVQRVGRASVSVHDRPVASIGPGLFVLLGIERGDDAALARRFDRKILVDLPNNPVAVAVTLDIDTALPAVKLATETCLVVLL
ncbi:MAG: hypothetical protein FGM38_07125 [Solirubrobacterales bacterium]|nr:hypothetical protein [Solirubrobacterales bacterium]